MERWTSPRRTRPGRRAVRFAIACAAAAGIAAADPEASSLHFARHGESVDTIDLEGLRRIAGARTLRVFDPYENGEVAFEAIPFRAVLDSVYGPDWRSEEEILFTCRDGYQPTVPTQRFLAHAAWLAFARADGSDFAIAKHESGRRQSIDVRPYYLVWDNLDDETLRQDADYGWPYQVVGVELIRAADRFPEMVPPAGASDEAKAGFGAFRIHCSRCHAVNGEGGTIGQELNDPVNPLDYRSAEWLRSWIDDPSAILPTARMPRLNPALVNREQVLDQLIRYLDAMRSARPSTSDGGASNDDR